MACSSSSGEAAGTSVERGGAPDGCLFGAFVVIGQWSFVEVECVLCCVLIRDIEVDVVPANLVDLDPGDRKLTRLLFLGPVTRSPELHPGVGRRLPGRRRRAL